MKYARRPSQSMSRRGFTLVELLVVIAIIGMLMGLVLPAVQSARESGRNTVCKSNMREVARAIMHYESARNQYPGYLDLFRHQNQNLYRRPLMVLLLPYLDRRDLADRFSTIADHVPGGAPLSSYFPGYQGLHLPVLNCPSANVALPRHTAFVYNTGTAPSWLGGPSVQNPADGVFLWNGNGQYIMTSDRVYDGLENTIMISENIQARYWTDTDERYIGMVWWDVEPSDFGTFFSGQPILTINQEKSAGIEPFNVISGTNAIRYARPSSNHPTSVNVAYCDGHVVELYEGIDYRTYVHMMTSKGRSCTAQSPTSFGGQVRQSVLGQ